MHPELFTLPGGFSIKTYGFFLMIGFLSAVWLAMRRAVKVNADPDVVLDLSFLALLFGVAGARAFYVIHYWETQFADASNKLVAIIDITRGGLEFLGGFLGAVAAILVYCWWKNRSGKSKISLRFYLDILAPSTAWGLAFGRLGCFFNGCCFGGLCVAGGAHLPAHPWAMKFPYASPPHHQQWEDRAVTVPAELMVTARDGALQPVLIPHSQLYTSVERRQAPFREVQDLREAYQEAKAEDPESEEVAKLQRELDAAQKRLNEHQRELFALLWALQFPSRENPSRNISVSELEALAREATTLPVHPTQLYSSVHAMLLYFLLAAIFYVRKRHGVVIGALFILYPVPRALLEIIRADNPTDVAGLTASQFISLCIMIAGAVYLAILYKKFPEVSPILQPAGGQAPAQ